MLVKHGASQSQNAGGDARPAPRPHLAKPHAFRETARERAATLRPPQCQLRSTDETRDE